MTQQTYGGNWKTDAHEINGQTGSHYDLARLLESQGFQVELDPDNNERSIVARPGNEDFGAREIGEIVGDAEAEVRITADLD